MQMKAIAVLSLVGLFAAAPARADDKTHQQIMAEIRMLQEQQAQLTRTLAGLVDTLKTVTTKIDDQSSVNRKTSADQKLLIDGIADNVRILREKADDTNVRLSSMTQELESMRHAVSSMPAPAAVLPTTPTSPTDPDAPPVTAPPVGAAPPPTASPDKMYSAAFSDFTGGQYDLAIQGFELYLRYFPKSLRAPEAQLNIGNSYYAQGKFGDAVTAFQKAIADYPQSDSIPTAYYKLGLSYEGLKQVELAKRAYETAIKNFPNAFDTQLARQRLDALNRK
jgi:tol-pal system protein YbgF